MRRGTESKKMIGRIAILGLIGTLLAAPAAAKDFEQRVAAQAGGRLRMELDSGSVVIESHDLEEVRVDALAAGMGAGRLDFELSARGEEVTLRGGPRGWMPALLGSPHVRVRVRVPSEFSVDVRTGGGAVEIEDLEGQVRLRTSGGPIELGRIRGDVRAETSGGAIEAGEVDGELHVRTSGGPIRVFEVTGNVEARTSGGSIEIFGAADRVEADTSGGAISVRFSEAPSGVLETSGGNIDVEFPENEGMDLDARTSGGSVRIDDQLAVRGRVEPTRVEAEVNEGGDRLRLRSSGGDILIRVR
jgi:DUF4097 and DUF4098 domain-containing protein YvlB